MLKNHTAAITKSCYMSNDFFSEITKLNLQRLVESIAATFCEQNGDANCIKEMEIASLWVCILSRGTIHNLPVLKQILNNK